MIKNKSSREQLNRLTKLGKLEDRLGPVVSGGEGRLRDQDQTGNNYAITYAPKGQKGGRYLAGYGNSRVLKGARRMTHRAATQKVLMIQALHGGGTARVIKVVRKQPAALTLLRDIVQCYRAVAVGLTPPRTFESCYLEAVETLAAWDAKQDSKNVT